LEGEEEKRDFRGKAEGRAMGPEEEKSVRAGPLKRKPRAPRLNKSTQGKGSVKQHLGKMNEQGGGRQTKRFEVKGRKKDTGRKENLKGKH